MAEIVWGDGTETQHEIFPLKEPANSESPFTWTAGQGLEMGAAGGLGCGRGRGVYEPRMAIRQRRRSPVVALDGYHNNESKMPDHYQWDGTRNGGFSEFGNSCGDWVPTFGRCGLRSTLRRSKALTY